MNSTNDKLPNHLEIVNTVNNGVNMWVVNDLIKDSNIDDTLSYSKLDSVRKYYDIEIRLSGLVGTCIDVHDCDNVSDICMINFEYNCTINAWVIYDLNVCIIMEETLATTEDECINKYYNLFSDLTYELGL